MYNTEMMENSTFNNDQELVNSMIDNTFGDEFLDFVPLFPEIFSSNNNSNNNPKGVLETTRVIEGLESSSRCFSFPPGKETSNNLNVISFETSSSSSFFGLIDESGRNSYAQKHEGFESSNDNEVPAHNLDSKSVSIVGTRCPSKEHDHLLAEQKRRDKMRQLFISLSTIVPGLKKLDKGTIIGEAIKYMKELKERVKMLEESTKKKSCIGSSFSYKSTTKASTCNDMSSSQGNPAGLNLDINARIAKNNVLIKICCNKQKANISNIQHQMELLHLDVVDIRIIPFGDSVVDVTILAEMSDDFCMTAKDIVQHLQLGF